MKYLIALVLCLSSLASFGTAKPEVKKAFKASVEIFQQTITDDATCSATAIGPQAILTDSHCELPTDDLIISRHTVQIVGRIRDGYDHTIYLVDGIQFEDYVTVEPNKVEITDHVFIWGNPGELSDMYREGMFSGIHRDLGLFGAGPLIMYFDLNTFNGDSGAGIFREDGVLVGTVSFSLIQGKENNVHRMTGAYPLHFKDEELQKAKTFTTPQKPKDSNDTGRDTK